eukprot:4015-Heterococcus_DN1.PRE.1
MALHGTSTIESAVIDRCAVGQLTGSVQSLLNVPANTPLIQLGNLQAQFQGTIRIESSTTTTVPAATHAVTLQIDSLLGDKPCVIMTQHGNPGVGIQT